MKKILKILFQIFMLLCFFSAIRGISKAFNYLVKLTKSDSAIRIIEKTNFLMFGEYFAVFFVFCMIFFGFFAYIIMSYVEYVHHKIKNRFISHLIVHFISYSITTSFVLALCCVLNSDQLSLVATLIAIIAIFGFLFAKSFPKTAFDFIDNMNLNIKEFLNHFF